MPQENIIYSNKDLLQKIIFIIIICGSIVGIIGNYIQYSVKNDSSGYNISFIGNILSIMGLIFIIPIIISFQYTSGKIITNTKVSIINHLPSILTIATISYNTTINQIYKTELNNANVAPEYYNYLFIYSILLLLQLIFLGKYITNLSSFDINSNSIYKSIIYLFSTLNIILLTIMRIILKYFSTDG